jgi:hypothetical protein
MEYRFKCDVRAKDLWEMAMARTYNSMIGLINVVFTVAMILLTIRFFDRVPDIISILLLLGCILFPVIQPLAIYGRSIRQLEDLPRDMEMVFSDRGVDVHVGEKRQLLKWKMIRNAIKRSNMIVVMSDDSHGYMLTNRVLGDLKEEFYSYLCQKIRNQF